MKNCRCATDGQLHGPYWYAYRKQGQKLKRWYVGKELKLGDGAEELSSRELTSTDPNQRATNGAIQPYGAGAALLLAFEPIRGHFHLHQHKQTASEYRAVMSQRIESWRSLAGVVTAA